MELEAWFSSMWELSGSPGMEAFMGKKKRLKKLSTWVLMKASLYSHNWLSH